MKNLYFLTLLLIAVILPTARAQVGPCLHNPIFSDTCCPIVMNEILPEGYSGETWVELYNCNPDTAVVLEGWFLSPKPDSTFFVPFPLGYTVLPNYYRVFSLPFTISRSFGLLQLFRPDSTLAYGITFDNVAIGESVGYCDLIITRQTPTPGLPNSCTVTSISEVPYTEGKQTFLYDLLGRRVASPVSGIFISVTEERGLRLVKKLTLLRE